ncbi:MAG: hypothetical protein OEM23_07000 [Gemmatimonadota bacterium]|nr:hypothetical protein [Gemmatimonadota bacterium]MDH3428166.1 hypothetical protein [Gemmatimonadota bacterium]
MTSDWRLALDMYVAGRNRADSTEQKQAAATAARRTAAPTRTSGTSIPGVAVFGVPIPQTLDCYRNAGTWRNGLNGASGDEAGSGA